MRSSALQRAFSKEEEWKLIKEMNEGDDEAKKRILGAYFHLVINMARKYKNKNIRMLYLIEQGNAGLVKAVKLFPKVKMENFILYALWCIRNAIICAVNNRTHLNINIKEKKTEWEGSKRWIDIEPRTPKIEKIQEYIVQDISESQNVSFSPYELEAIMLSRLN